MYVILGLIIASMVIMLIPGFMSGMVGGSNRAAVASGGGPQAGSAKVKKQVSKIDAPSNIEIRYRGFIE